MWPSDSLCYFPRQVQHSPRRIPRRQDVRWILFPLESHTQRCQKIGFAVFWLRQATSPCILCLLQTWRNIYSDQHITISCSFRGRLRLGHYCKMGCILSWVVSWKGEGEKVTLLYNIQACNGIGQLIKVYHAQWVPEFRKSRDFWLVQQANTGRSRVLCHVPPLSREF